MDIELSAEERKFRDDVRAWILENLPKSIAEKVLSGKRLSRTDTQDWAKILGKKNWLTHSWPSEFGGVGWNVMERHIFQEECARAGAPMIMPFGPVMVAPVIMKFGTKQQQERFLPGIASGEVWWAQGYSEPGAGSDLASLSTRAVRKGDFYILNGQKTWTTLGQYGDWMFALVRTNDNGKPQAGISFVVFDMNSPGVSVRPIKMLDGEYEINDVYLDDVKIPLNQLIGEENEGWTYAKYLLSFERTNVADVGAAKRELTRLKAIAHREGVWDSIRFRDMIALLEIDIISLEMLVLRFLSELRSDGNMLDSAGILKIKASEIQQRYTELMMLAAGPYSLPWISDAMNAGWQGEGDGDRGFHLYPGDEVDNASLAATYFNFRKTTIYGGSNEIQREIIAKNLLG